MSQLKQEQTEISEEGSKGGEEVMPHRHTERASEEIWSAEHEDDILEHLPTSFQVLAKFALKGGEKDAERTRLTK